MISHTFTKEEDINKDKTISKLVTIFIKRMSLISFFAGETVIVGSLLAKICLFCLYTKFLGLICFFIQFQGIAQVPFNKITKILNRTFFLLEHPHLYKLFIILMFLYNLFFVLFFVIIFLSIKTRHNSTFIINLIRIYQLMNLINFWILGGMEIEMSLLILTGVEEEVIFYKVISVINILISLSISVIYCFYGNKVEFNFELCDYLSRLDSLCEFYLLLSQIILSVNFVLFMKYGNGSYNGNIYLGIYCGVAILSTLILTSNAFYYYMDINSLVLIFNLATAYSSIVALIIHNIGVLNGGDFLISAGYLILYPVSKVIYSIYWKKLLGKIPFVEIKKEFVLCKYMLMLIYLICQENLSEGERLKLIGIVKQHQQNCAYESCVCKDEQGTVLYIPKTESEYQISNANFSYEQSKIYFKHLIVKEFEFLIKVTRNNNNNLIMMFSYYMLFYIGNYYASIYALINLKKKKNLNYQQKTSLSRMFEMIHHKIESINNGSMKRVNVDKTEETFKVDFSNLILFYEKVTKLKTAINLALEFSTQFWTCIQNRVDIHLIKKNGLEFYKYHNLIEETYTEIAKIYSYLDEINMYYIRYKAAVFNEQPEMMYSLNTSMNGNLPNSKYPPSSSGYPGSLNLKLNEENLQENEKYYHPKSVIVIANLTDKNKAIIEKITENIKGLLNYSPTECLGQDVKLLMPNIYKGTHNHFIQMHFETGKNNVVNHEKPTFALHANYYSVPIMISIKMLPSYSDNVYYVGVLREIPIDYDFIITTENGKIEMISKGIFNKIFNNTSISLYNSIDYYINFICKEYFKEISQIYDPNYKLTDFTKENPEKKEYRYALLHFKSDNLIDSILRDFKKNESNSFNANQNSILESPIMKIIQIKDRILQNYKVDSIKRYTKIEKFNIFLNEYLYKFKLYSNINSDANVNLDEIKMVDKYINKKEDDIEDKFHSVRILYGTPEPNSQNSISNQNPSTPKYDASMLEKSRERQKSPSDFGFSSNDEEDKKNVDKEQFKAYLTMKNRYSQKQEYAEVKFIIFYNILFLSALLTGASLNFAKNEESLLDIFRSLNNEYFEILPLFSDLSVIHKNFQFIIRKDTYFNELQKDKDYIEYLYSNCKLATSNLTNNIKLLTDNFFDFSDDFLDNFNQSVAYHRANYLYLNMTLDNALLSMVNFLNSIGDISQINSDNDNIKNVMLNLNLGFYQKLSVALNSSLNSTLDKIDKLRKKKLIYSTCLMSLIILFCSYVYSRILCFYCVQNNMISLLLSIDIDECDKILKLIRELKTISQKKQNESSKTGIVDGEKKEAKEEDNQEEGRDETDNLIEPDQNQTQDDGSTLANRITKVVNEQADRKKKLKKKIKSQLPSKSTIPAKVYLSFLIRIMLILFLNLSPYIFSLSYLFYDKKCSKLVVLIQNINMNTFTFLLNYLLFQNITLSETYLKTNHDALLFYLNEMKENQFNTTLFLFDALYGIKDQNDFEIFFTKNFCSKAKVPTTYCNSTSPYFDQSFLYIMNINIELIEDILFNTKLISQLTKTQEEIKNYLHDPRVFLADETFNLLTIYGFREQNSFIMNMISTFVNRFHSQIIIVFIFNIIFMVLNQIISVWLMKHIIEAVDVELKNIFSLMPFPLALMDQNIKDLLSR